MMFNRIGGKIKGVTVALFVFETIAAVIIGIVLIALDDEVLLGIGLIVLLLGPILAWISSWLLYGYGEIIDKLCDIEENTRHHSKKPQTNPVKKDEYVMVASDGDEDKTPQRICPRCGVHHDFDCPFCPNCRYKYGF